MRAIAVRWNTLVALPTVSWSTVTEVKRTCDPACSHLGQTALALLQPLPADDIKPAKPRLLHALHLREHSEPENTPVDALVVSDYYKGTHVLVRGPQAGLAEGAAGVLWEPHYSSRSVDFLSER